MRNEGTVSGLDLRVDSALLGLLCFLKQADYYFVTTSPATHHRVNKRLGNRHARSIRDIFGWNRPFEKKLLPEAVFETLTKSLIITEGSDGWKSRIRASSIGDEIFLHSSYPTVDEDAVFFGPDTYRFVKAIQTHLSMKSRRIERVLDIGCGSGAAGVIIAKRFSAREVLMTDVNATALRLSRTNIDFAGTKYCRSFKSDLFQQIDGQFDLIVSNPPYLNDPLKRTYRHGGGTLGSELSIKIVEASLSRLAPLGTLLLYTGSPIVDGKDALLESIEKSLRKTSFDWSYEEIDPDVFGEELDTSAYKNVDRIAAVVLSVENTEGVRC